MQATTPPRSPDDTRYPQEPTIGARRARYSRAPAAGGLTLRTNAFGLFPPRRPHHPPPLAVGGPHAVVPNSSRRPDPVVRSLPVDVWPVLECRSKHDS